MRDNCLAGIRVVGETIDPLTAHRMARAGELVQMFRGVYVAPGGSVDDRRDEWSFISSVMAGWLISVGIRVIVLERIGRQWLDWKRHARQLLVTVRRCQQHSGKNHGSLSQIVRLQVIDRVDARVVDT